MKNFFRRPSTIAFLVFALAYALAMAFVFNGTWSLDCAPVEPDNPTSYAIDDGAKWIASVLAGGRFVPSDLMHIVGGMYFWQELQYALAGFLAALGVVFYLRGRGLPLVAAYCGGAFGLMGYCFTLYSAGHLGWFIWLMYGPFAFGLVDRAVRRGGVLNWALLGAVLAWASAQQPDMWLLFTVLTFAYGVWCLVRERAKLRLRSVAIGVVVTAAAALVIGAPQFSKAILVDLAGREKQIAGASSAKSGGEAAKDDAKAREERWLFCTSWSLPPEDTLEFLVPDVHGTSSDPRIHSLPGNRPYAGRLGQHGIVPPGSGGRHPVTGEMLKPGDHYWMPYRQHSLYFGFITLLLAVVGAASCFLRRRDGDSAGRGDAPFWLGAAVLMYIFALGGFTPFYRLVFALPFGDSIRCPVKFVHLLEFCTAVLAGYGAAFLLRRFGKTRPWVAVAVAVAAVVNIFDLARIDARYLAVEDVSFQRAPNAAAADALRLGGGAVFVQIPPREGGEMVKQSLGLHLAETADDAKNARFILAGGTALRDDATLRERVKSGALVTVGTYALSRAGVRPATTAAANLVLLQVPGVEPSKKTPPPVNRMAQLATLLSVLGTCTVLGAAGWRETRRFISNRRRGA